MSLDQVSRNIIYLLIDENMLFSLTFKNEM